MDELLKKLLEAEILTEDTKAELEEAFKSQLTEAIETAKAVATATVTAELNEQWIKERETLIEAIDSKVSSALNQELKELSEDIERFRDLEADYAEKLVEAKSEMANTLKDDMSQLIEKLDTFLEIRLTAELEELREDFDVVKKNQFGKTVFEAFVSEFKKHYAEDGSIEARLNETELRLTDALTALEQAEKKSAKLERSTKMEKVLMPLSGRTKEVMEAILKNVDTYLLEDAYKTYIGRVLKETSTEEELTSEKENKVLAEGKKEKKAPAGVTKNGDNMERIIEESAHAKKDAENRIPVISEADKAHLRKLAGII
ncbi:MAG: hypothetical protein ACXW2E_02025 [Nitrososphaeraceae archaeon]